MISFDMHKKDTEKASAIKRAFSEVHSKITIVEKKMNELNEEASHLIQQLTEIRSLESDFIKGLSQKYGPGKLDPFELKWIKDN